MQSVETLEKLGLTTASNKVKDVREMKRKLAVAYEHFRFCSPDKIDRFNKKLYDETIKDDRYKELCFIPLESYTDVPPDAALMALEAAQGKNCFDSYEVAKVEDKVVDRDPIIFGRIKNCKDRFFIAQWDHDVKIEDILKANEG